MREHRIPANVVSSGFEVEVLQSSLDVPRCFRIHQTWVHEKSIVICFGRESKAIVLWSVRLRRLGSGNWDCRCFQSWMVTSSRMSSATVQQSVHVRKQESGSWLCCCHSPDVFRGTCHGSFWLRSEILSCWGSLPSSCQLQRETGGVHCWLSHHPLFWATGWTHQEVETVLNWQQFLHFQTWYQKQSHFLSILGLPDSAILSAKSFEPIFSLCLSSKFSPSCIICISQTQKPQQVARFEDMPSSKIFPNIISLNAAIASCEKGHQWLLALHFLQCSRWTSMRPDVISYSSVLSACATQGQWRWALEVYGRMKGETLEMWLDVISCNAAGPRTGFFGDAAGHPNKSGEVLMSVRNMFLKTGF